MADISAEIAAFQNAVYGEEVRSSMVSAIEKINDVCEDAESTVDSFESSITTAISNANTAASAANTAASNANTKASAANTAATNANTARTAANNAATAANNAASAATTTNTNITNAESARVTAEQARATAESARQANEQSRQTAETARVNAESARASAESSRASAESQRQSNESTRQGNENVRQTQEGLRVSAENTRVNEFEDMQAAFADMQRQIIPQATESTMGGVIVGDGLNVENALLSLATTKSGSGTAVASNGAVLESVVVHGQSVQDGTPTPDAPVDVQVVQGVNLFSGFANTTPSSPVASVDVALSGNDLVFNGTASGTGYAYQANSTGYDRAPKVTLQPGTYTVHETTGMFGVRLGTGPNNTYFDVAPKGESHAITITEETTLAVVPQIVNGTVFTNASPLIMIERGSTATPYVPYGSIGIVIGDTATPIDLQGNVLASLPDGTRDTVTVDSAGHCVLVKRVAYVNMDGVTVKATDMRSPSGTATAYRFVIWDLPYAATISSSDRSNFYCSVAVYNANAASTADKQANGQASLYQYSSKPSLLFCIDGFSSVQDANTWFSTNLPKLAYKLATPETIDLGYIDIPTIPEDATISVSASMTPVIDAAWWERGAEALANIVKAFSERIKALEEAVAELATA